MADSEDDVPPERDIKDFSFKQMRKIRMFEAPQSLPTPRTSLLAVSSKFGLTFVGCHTGLKVIKTETIERIHESDEGSMQNVVTHCPSSFIEVGHCVQFVGLSGNDLTLSVCYENADHTVMTLFDVPSLGSTNSSYAKFGEITVNSDPGVNVVNLVWNPGFPGLFAVCLSSGSVIVMELTDTAVKTIATLPQNLKASAIGWSPKGKQLVVGHRDGRLTQYSQVLEVKKEIECPEMFTDDPHLVTDVLWITPTLFAAVYSSFEDGDCPKFLLISTPKNEPVTVKNLDDIYYVMNDERQPAFYLRHISEWSLVVSACSNGLEAAVVGKYGGEATTLWEKWSFEEDGRPSMPLTNDNDETFPMGLAFDFSSTRPIAKGEERLPPAPIMMILSTDGVLCSFYMVNQTPNTSHDIVKAPEPLPLGGQRKAVVSKMADHSLASQTTGGPGTAQRGPLQPGPVSLRTSKLPVGAFSKQTIPASAGQAGLSGMPGYVAPIGAFSIGSSKQGTLSSGTPATNTPSVFSFASPKQNVPLVAGTGAASLGTLGNVAASAFSFAGPKPTVPLSSGAAFPGVAPGTPASAFSLTGQKEAGLPAFKPSSQSQVPATEVAKPLVTPQLVKPTPTSLAGSPFQSPGPLANAANAKPITQPQSVSLGGDRPKAISSVPSQVTGQGLLQAQPKPTPVQPAVTKPPPARPGESTALGFKLPGQSVDDTRKEITKKAVPVAKGNVIEASVSKHIQEAITLFNKEMATLRESVKNMQSNCCLTDDNKDLHTFRKTTDNIGRSLAQIRDATKDQHKDIDEEKRKLFEAFEMFEDAKIKQERKNDPRYVQLLKSRALDPVNTSKMRDIRNLHLYLDKTLREVNMVLDEQWNKENECKRSIQRPALDEIYHTLKVNHRIAQDQGAKLEKITEDMKNRKLLSTSWQRNSLSTSSGRDDLSSRNNPFVVHREELKSPSQRASAPISPEKQAQLRSMFQKRRNTPVRRSMIVPSSTVAKTPTVKSSEAEVPCFSSTPAIKPGATAGGNKDTIRFSLPITEQEEESDADGSVSEEGSQFQGDEPQEDEEELEQLSAGGAVPALAGGFSLGGSTFVPAVSATAKVPVKDEGELKKPTAQPVRIAAADSSQSKPTATGAFSSVVKPGGSQVAPSTAQAEPPKASGGGFLPANKPQPSSATAAQSKGDFTPCVKVISTETPPNVAAAMAAMSRASAAQSAVPPSSSSLDPSASIEPVTLVAYKPQTQEGTQGKDQDAQNTAAKAIANAALMAATAEAQKPSTKPQCSTEFILKSTESGKPGPPVVTFKPPNASPQTSASGFTVAPNVTVFKPAFGPAAPSSSTVRSTSGLQQSVTGTLAATPFSQLSTSSAPFAPPSGGLFNLGATSSTPIELSKAGTQAAASSAAGAGTDASAPGITPSPRVSRNLFASDSQTSPTGQQPDSSKQSGSNVQVTAASPSIASSSGTPTPATTPAGFTFSAPAQSSGGFFKLGSSSNTGSAFGSGNVGSTSTSILSALLRTSGTSNTSNLFATGSATVSTTSAPPSMSKGTPSENRDTSAETLPTPSSVGIPASAGGVFAQALSESSKPSMQPSGSTIIFGAAATTAACSPGGLFGQPSAGAKTDITGPSTTTVSNLLGLSAGSPSSAFSSTSSASPFFPSINSAATKASAPPGSSTAAVTTSTPEGASNSAATGLLGKGTSTTSAFGAVPSAGSSGLGSPGTTATTSASTGLFGAPASTATTSASTGLFGAPASTATTSASTGLFGAPASTANTSAGSTVFGAPASTASTSAGASVFGAPTSTANTSAGSTVFGAPPSTASTSAGASVFGAPPSTASTSAGASLFGAPPSTAFAPTSVFGASSGSGSFGSPQPFGSTVSSAPVFGSPSTTAGAGSVLAPQPAFGQSSFSPTTRTGFGQAASKPAESALGFGFSGFGLGGQGSSQNNKTNPFLGAVQGFSGTAASQSSLFGGKSGADIFKASDSSKPSFGSGPFSQSGFGSQSSGGFSSQGGSVMASGFGFGAPSTPGSGSSNTAGFGSSQPFGSPSAGGSVFGGAPSFGSSPSFGGAPTFGGSPQGGLGATPSGGIFGGVGSSGGFGQSSGSPTFGSIASQSSLPSFGAIAGQSSTQVFGSVQPQPQPQPQQQQQQSPSFGSFGGGSQSPSGASFSQWR